MADAKQRYPIAGWYFSSALPLCDAGVGGYAGTHTLAHSRVLCSVSDRSKEVSDLAPHASVWLVFG